MGEKEDIRDKTEDEIRNSVKFLTECFGDIPIGDIYYKREIKYYQISYQKLPKE